MFSLLFKKPCNGDIVVKNMKLNISLFTITEFPISEDTFTFMHSQKDRCV